MIVSMALTLAAILIQGVLSQQYKNVFTMTRHDYGTVAATAMTCPSNFATLTYFQGHGGQDGKEYTLTRVCGELATVSTGKIANCCLYALFVRLVFVYLPSNPSGYP